MKLCNSPPRTTCMYQLARDQALDPGASSDAYEQLCTFLQENLSPDVLGEAQSLLRHFVDQSGSGAIAADQPAPFPGRPRPGGELSMDEMQRRVAVAAQINAGKVLAQRHLFDQKFPAAARIRRV